MAGLAVIFFTLRFLGIDPEPIFSLVVATSPIWLPLFAFFVFFERWMWYVGVKYAVGQGRTTLRIKLPQEVTKSPEAMEFVLAQIHNVHTPDNHIQTYVDGKRPLPFSFELVSIGGEVRFYVNVPTSKTKNAFETQMYAQYPGVEIVEEPLDYTADVWWNPNEFEYFSVHMGKKQDQEFPIKTYIDYGMDKLPKEEEKVDPITPMLEQLASLQPYERMWIQINATPHREQNFKHGQLSFKPSWETKVTQKIDTMLGRDKSTKLGPGEFEMQPRLTTGERDAIAAMERNAGKYAYEVGIQWMYVSKVGKFNGNLIGPTIRTFSQYDIIGRNAIGVRWRTDFNWNWFSDPFGGRKRAWKKYELHNFKLRKYYNYTPADAPKIMTVEELATMFHLPGKVALTPTLGRIPSTRSEAPANLPIGTQQS